MLIYLIVFFLSTVLLKLSESQSRRFSCLAVIALLLPALLAGARDVTIGTDTEPYFLVYENVKLADSLFELLLLSNAELFFGVLSYIAAPLGGFPFLLFIYQGLTILFVYLAAYKYRQYLPVWLAIFLYFCFFYNISLNIMRQCLAITYVLYISTLLFEHKTKRFFIFSLFSVCFHTSAILGCLFVYIIYRLSNMHGRQRIVATSLFLLFVCVALLSYNKIILLISSIKFGRLYAYTAYMEGGDFDGALSITDLFFRFVFFLFLLYTSHNKLIKSNLAFIYGLLIVLEFLLLLLGVYSKFAYRVVLYLTIYHTLFLPLIANSKRFTYKSVYLLEFAIMLLGMAYWLWIIVYRGTSMTVPYEFA